MKYVFITGGVVSSLGKGITAASLGRLLKARGYTVSLQKLDLYYNVEPGFLSPLEHGEAFITDDGTAADLDLGHYERFVDVTLTGQSSSTTGKIHRRIIDRELRGDYHGATIQAIPHVANEIKDVIREAAKVKNADVAIIEIGGTAGDMESSVYLEAIRQMRWDCENPNDCCYVHVTLMPYISTASELKTKPTQHSVKYLRSIGIQPDVIVCRTEVPMTGEAKDKIALFCNVKSQNVIQNLDVPLIYELPLVMEKEGLAKVVLGELGMEDKPADLSDWRKLVDDYKAATKTVRVALVGKYTAVPDAYLSVSEALKHAGIGVGAHVDITDINSETLTKKTVDKLLENQDAILLPGGYGARGAEGIILAAQYAREHGVPCLSIGLGMQLSVVEAARNLCGYENANSTEVDPRTPYPIVKVPEDRICQNDSRSATRIGAVEVKLQKGLIQKQYGKDKVRERHGNRYEIDQEYIKPLAEKSYAMVGTGMDGGYPECFELTGHPYYVGVIYHPEFISRPGKPHPLFTGLLNAAVKRADHLQV